MEEKAKLNSFSNTTYIYNEENIGYNQAFNKGLKYLSSLCYDYIIGVNSDVNISKDAILSCFDVLNKKDDIAVGSSLINSSPKINGSARPLVFLELYMLN